MLSNMVWRPEPQYDQSLIVAISFVLQAIVTGVIFGYLRSKSLASKTVMDLVNIVFLSWLILTAICKVVICVVLDTWSDCGHLVAIIVALVNYIIIQNVILETLAIFVIQFCLVMHPWLLESNRFETWIKYLVSFAIPFVSMMITIGLMSSFLSHPPSTYYHLRSQKATLFLAISSPALILRIILIAAVVITCISLQIGIKVSGRPLNHQSSNHVICVKDWGLTCAVYFILMFLSLQLKLFEFKSVTNVTLLYYVALRVYSHPAIVDYVLNRLPTLRALFNRLAVRSARIVGPADSQNAA